MNWTKEAIEQELREKPELKKLIDIIQTFPKKQQPEIIHKIADFLRKTDEEQIMILVDSYQQRLEEKYESYVNDKLFKWIGDQGEDLTPEAVKNKREQLETELAEWIDEQVAEYRESLQ